MPRRRDHAVDQPTRARRPPELAVMNQDVDPHRTLHDLEPLADAPPVRKTAPVTTRGTGKDNASGHGSG